MKMVKRMDGCFGWNIERYLCFNSSIKAVYQITMLHTPHKSHTVLYPNKLHRRTLHKQLSTNQRPLAFLPLRSHHHPLHPPHGRGGHLGRPHRHHLPREDVLLWLLPLPEEVLRQRLLPDPGESGRGDDLTAPSIHAHSGQRGNSRKCSMC